MAGETNADYDNWHTKHDGKRVRVNDSGTEGDYFALFDSADGWEDGSVNRAVKETADLNSIDTTGYSGEWDIATLNTKIVGDMLYGHNGTSRNLVPIGTINFRGYPTPVGIFGSTGKLAINTSYMLPSIPTDIAAYHKQNVTSGLSYTYTVENLPAIPSGYVRFIYHVDLTLTYPLPFELDSLIKTSFTNFIGANINIVFTNIEVPLTIASGDTYGKQIIVVDVVDTNFTAGGSECETLVRLCYKDTAPSYISDYDVTTYITTNANQEGLCTTGGTCVTPRPVALPLKGVTIAVEPDGSEACTNIDAMYDYTIYYSDQDPNGLGVDTQFYTTDAMTTTFDGNGGYYYETSGLIRSWYIIGSDGIVDAIGATSCVI